MRLWHYQLIPKLPRQQLLGQWRECIALLGNGWGKKHSTVDYVFKYPDSYLVRYTYEIYKEMKLRGYKPEFDLIPKAMRKRMTNDMIEFWFSQVDMYVETYPEHDDKYYQECIENLKSKGVMI